LDETGDWYAEQAHLELIERLRDQVRFESREALSRQIEKDVERVRAMAHVAT
jgi:FAD synthase